MTRDDELLAKIVAGEVARDAGAARELFARRPELVRHVRELERLALGLDHAAREQRDVLAAARADVSQRDREHVRAALQAGPGVVRNGGGRATRLQWIAAAAVLLLAAGTWLALRGAAGDGSRQLLDGAGAIELVGGPSELRAGAVFEWRGELRGAERWRIELRERGAGGARGRLLGDFTCREASWSPHADDLRDLPAEVLWSVHRIDSGGISIEHSQPLALPVVR